eukprot:CAMPEP_0197427996 /NCGR_PEP_ID=MMETSP1170-20131217/39876_1 /TAXON_ID=54406 /ORGANISM="Sarcinochrysis sp, Strain CCMP770" /LENGTH=136 /DNA_ID=CAMNT_0042955715 /DNA_START=36 /DNA_END=446 /DNA_ORIENTATION=+
MVRMISLIISLIGLAIAPVVAHFNCWQTFTKKVTIPQGKNSASEQLKNACGDAKTAYTTYHKADLFVSSCDKPGNKTRTTCKVEAGTDDVVLFQASGAPDTCEIFCPIECVSDDTEHEDEDHLKDEHGGDSGLAHC